VGYAAANKPLHDFVGRRWPERWKLSPGTASSS
jgi:hypothetical protein